jgi:hypothetical protein
MMWGVFDSCLDVGLKGVRSWICLSAKSILFDWFWCELKGFGTKCLKFLIIATNKVLFLYLVCQRYIFWWQILTHLVYNYFYLVYLGKMMLQISLIHHWMQVYLIHHAKDTRGSSSARNIWLNIRIKLMHFLWLRSCEW